MGEVYRARDTRLDGAVAIKLLPTNLAQNADLKQRFEREAKTISGLSHPHICALYDVGELDGASFLVMEYLEGESLADRLAKGALPVHQVLRYGIEIADALSVAHRHGVVHRDLKPANVMLTRSGAKLLDFGLAKLRPPDDFLGGGPLSALPTADKPLTEKGSILGTVQYMAPEQLEGKDADARTDVFALGELLYEMATGRRAFAGQSRASLIAAILSAEPPPISSLQPMSPPALDRIVRTCLAKDPDERWQSAHDVAAELKWVSEGGSQVTHRLPSPAAAIYSQSRRDTGPLRLGCATILTTSLPRGQHGKKTDRRRPRVQGSPGRAFEAGQDPPEERLGLRRSHEGVLRLSPCQCLPMPGTRSRSSCSGRPSLSCGTRSRTRWSLWGGLLSPSLLTLPLPTAFPSMCEGPVPGPVGSSSPTWLRRMRPSPILRFL
jgi:serine/threonine protein kinase